MVIWIYSNSTAGYRSKGIEMRIRKSHLYPHVYRHTIHSNQAMESAEIFVDRWMEKESLTCAYNGILALRRKGILSFVAAMMGLEGIMLNKSQKDKYWIFEFACGTQRVASTKEIIETWLPDPDDYYTYTHVLKDHTVLHKYAQLLWFTKNKKKKFKRL